MHYLTYLRITGQLDRDPPDSSIALIALALILGIGLAALICWLIGGQE